MDELIAELKSKREAMGLSVSDLFQRTRINTDVIEALEAGNFDVLPEAYVKLFLKRYAQEVKLDDDEIVRKFEGLQWKSKATTSPQIFERDEGTPGWVIGVAAALAIAAIGGAVVWQSGSTSPPSSVSETIGSTPAVASRQEPAQAEPPAQTPTPRSQPGQDTTTGNLNPSIPFESQSEEVVATPSEPDPPPAVESTENAPGNTQENEPETPAAEATPAPPTTDTERDAPTEPEPAVQAETSDEPESEITERVVSAYSLNLTQDLAASEDGLNLNAIGLEPTQVKVTSDGDPVFDGFVDAGRQQNWSAKDRFSVEIQEGAHVRLELQGEALPAVGAAGRRVRLYISRFSIWVEEIEPSDLAASPSEP